MKRGLQQGQADRLCGLYAILNFLSGTKQWRSENNTGALRYILDAVRHFGWLTPYHLTDGFEDHQLKAILELQFANYRMPCQAFFLDDVAQAKKPKNFNDLAAKVIEKHGSVIAGRASAHHWVLVTRLNEEATIIDSAANETPIKRLSRRGEPFSLAEGIVIMPRNLPPIEIAL